MSSTCQIGTRRVSGFEQIGMPRTSATILVEQTCRLERTFSKRDVVQTKRRPCLMLAIDCSELDWGIGSEESRSNETESIECPLFSLLNYLVQRSTQQETSHAKENLTNSAEPDRCTWSQQLEPHRSDSRAKDRDSGVAYSIHKFYSQSACSKDGGRMPQKISSLPMSKRYRELLTTLPR